MENFFSSYALAQSASGGPTPTMLEQFGPILLMIIIMYFLILRPQQKKNKELENLITALKVGDEVVTTGGIIAKVKSIADSFVTLEVGGNTNLKIKKTNIVGLSKAPAKSK